MRIALNSLIIMLIFSGCDSIGKVKSENPVIGPPPPRMRITKESKSDSKVFASTSEIQLVKNEDSHDSFIGNHVIAMVNGEPIFASEITDMHSGQMKGFEEMVANGKATEEQFAIAREQLCKAYLPKVIKRHVLLTEMKKNLTTEQQDGLQAQLDEGFNSHIENMKIRNNVQTKYELEKILAAQNISLVDMKYLIMNEELAKFYENSKAKEKFVPNITRADLIAEYNKRKETYKVDGTVKWQQISINYDQDGGKDEALDIIKNVIDKLGEGASFEELAKEYSTGPTAHNGGHWDWMKPDSFAKVVVGNALQTLPEGKISQVLEGKKKYHLIRILKRKQTHTVSFEAVQEKIKKDLAKEQRRAAFEEVYKTLLAQADIQTIFDQAIEQKETVQESTEQKVTEDQSENTLIIK